MLDRCAPSRYNQEQRSPLSCKMTAGIYVTEKRKERKAMPISPEPKREHPSTYFVQDRSNQQELNRLQIQDQMLTTSVGAVLPEQPDPTAFHRALDVGCATAGWLPELAQTTPTYT